MIIIEIPGREPLRIDHVVLDYNGTVAVDGLLLKGAGERISRLREHVKVHVLTRQCEPLGVEVRTFPREGAAGCKEEIVRGLEGGVACLGNGFNDIQMFDAARLSIAVLEREGMCAALLGHAAVVVRSIGPASEAGPAAGDAEKLMSKKVAW